MTLSISLMERILLAILLLSIAMACGRQTNVNRSASEQIGSNGSDKKETNMKKNDTWQEHPNVYARLVLAKKGPVLPKIEGVVEIWIKSPKFRVRDNTGRFVYEICGDIASNRGLGQPPQSIEEIIDIQSRFRDKPAFGVTELFGDIASGQGLVCESEKAPWVIEAKKIAPVAEQIFSPEIEKYLKPVRATNRFERACTEYRGFLEGEEDGTKFKSEIRLIISPPFVFLNEVHDAEISSYYFIRECVDFREGKVTDVDVEPPK